MLGLAHVSLPPLPGDAASAAMTSEFEVDTAKAKRVIQRRPPHDVVAYGHLLPYVLPPRFVTRMVVLRCEPMVLKDRLSHRGYSFQKIVENVEAELIGVIASDAMVTFGRDRTMEVDTTGSSAMKAAQMIVRSLQARTTVSPRIDWMSNYGSARRLRSLLSPEDPRRG